MFAGPKQTLSTLVNLTLLLLLFFSGSSRGASDDRNAKQNQIRDVRIFREDGMLNILTISGEELRAWQVSEMTPQEPWQLKRTWSKFVYLWYGLADGRDVIVVTKDGAELFHIGSWEKARISEADGLSGTIKNVWRILSNDPTPEFSAIAVELAGTSGAAAESRWMLFSGDGADRWNPLALMPAIDSIEGFVRIGPGEIAIKGNIRDSAHGSLGNWHLYRLNGTNGWQVMLIPSQPDRIIDLKTYDYPNGLAIKNEQAGQEDHWQWFLRDASNSWRALDGVIEQAPKHIEDVVSYGNGDVLAVLGADNSKAENNDLAWQYFYHASQGKWVPMSSMFETLSNRPFAVKTFAGNRGIAFQKLNQMTGLHAANWLANYLNDDGQWVSIQDLLKVCPRGIWDLQSFAKNLGLGVECADEPNDPLHSFQWNWFASTTKSWQPLLTLIPQSPTHGWSVFSEDLKVGVAVADDRESSGSMRPPVGWSWFLPTKDGSWAEIGQVVQLPEGFPDRENLDSVSFPENDDKILRNGVLGIWDRDGKAKWFLRTKTGWLSITDVIRN